MIAPLLLLAVWSAAAPAAPSAPAAAARPQTGAIVAVMGAFPPRSQGMMAAFLKEPGFPPNVLADGLEAPSPGLVRHFDREGYHEGTYAPAAEALQDAFRLEPLARAEKLAGLEWALTTKLYDPEQRAALAAASEWALRELHPRQRRKVQAAMKRWADELGGGRRPEDVDASGTGSAAANARLAPALARAPGDRRRLPPPPEEKEDKRMTRNRFGMGWGSGVAVAALALVNALHSMRNMVGSVDGAVVAAVLAFSIAGYGFWYTVRHESKKRALLREKAELTADKWARTAASQAAEDRRKASRRERR